MRERPETLDTALELAQQHLAVETAQKRLQRRAPQSHTLAPLSEPDVPTDDGPAEANAVRWPSGSGGKSQVEELSKQVLRLSEELAHLRADCECPRPRPRQQRREEYCAGTVGSEDT